MEKLLELIDKKIQEIENYAISTQEDEERYIHEINCLILESRFLLLRTINETTAKKIKKGVDMTYPICHTSIIV